MEEEASGLKAYSVGDVAHTRTFIASLSKQPAGRLDDDLPTVCQPRSLLAGQLVGPLLLSALTPRARIDQVFDLQESKVRFDVEQDFLGTVKLQVILLRSFHILAHGI